MEEQPKKFWIKLWTMIKRKWWYILLLIISSIYVWHYRFDIHELSPLNAQSLIFILWLILLAFPLFSEIEFLGVKVKKEIEKAKDEVKSSLQNLQSQLTQLQLNNSMATNISLGNSSLPSEQKLEELLQIVRGLQTSPTHTEAPNQINRLSAEEKAVSLFKARLGIETSLRDLCVKIGYEEKAPIIKMVQLLNRAEVIDGITVDLISQVIKISNRGVHGEIVSDEYIDFVNETYPEIQRKLTAASERLRPVVCPHCKYVGYSTYENVCPNCGFVHDDD